MQPFNLKQSLITIVGLGYVGLPLAVLLAKKYKVIGFDENAQRIASLQKGIDKTLEINTATLRDITTSTPYEKGLFFTSEKKYICNSNIYIIAVPTPVTRDNIPDLSSLISATKIVGSVLQKDDIVIYESTVYPGATEEECVPMLESSSKLKFNKDFFVGYSPERINPGDKNNKIENIKKVTSGSNEETAEIVDQLYSSIIEAGTYKAQSIKVAEASKIMENVQRDVNVALMNEFAIIFNKLGIETNEVLNAAKTKWNFLPFTPGLVGGHCTGVDPYYLIYEMKEKGYLPKVISEARAINDNMGAFVAQEIQKFLWLHNHNPSAKILILGITFKENCTDIRNTKVIDIVKLLQQYGYEIDIFDPWADEQEVKDKLGYSLIKNLSNKKYSMAVLAVGHEEFKNIDFDDILVKDGCIYDIKSFYQNQNLKFPIKYL